MVVAYSTCRWWVSAAAAEDPPDHRRMRAIPAYGREWRRGPMWRNVLFSLQHRCTRSPRRRSTDDSPQKATGCGWGGPYLRCYCARGRALARQPERESGTHTHTRNRTTAAGAMTHSESTCTIILLKLLSSRYCVVVFAPPPPHPAGTSSLSRAIHLPVRRHTCNPPPKTGFPPEDGLDGCPMLPCERRIAVFCPLRNYGFFFSFVAHYYREYYFVYFFF